MNLDLGSFNGKNSHYLIRFHSPKVYSFGSDKGECVRMCNFFIIYLYGLWLRRSFDFSANRLNAQFEWFLKREIWSSGATFGGTFQSMFALFPNLIHRFFLFDQNSIQFQQCIPTTKFESKKKKNTKSSTYNWFHIYWTKRLKTENWKLKIVFTRKT